MNPSELQENFDDAALGVGAETVLRVLGPQIDRRLEALLDQFGHCEPKMEILLDFRAKITELQRLKRELGNLKKKGRVAASELQLVVNRTSSGG